MGYYKTGYEKALKDLESLYAEQERIGKKIEKAERLYLRTFAKVRQNVGYSYRFCAKHVALKPAEISAFERGKKRLTPKAFKCFKWLGDHFEVFW